jgi:hypothetical protein
MGFYYHSACHDCKIKIMWSKCPEETALILHERFNKGHKGHDTQVSHDYDDEFDDKTWEYEDNPSEKYENMDD